MIELPLEVIELLRERAIRRGRSLEEFILDAAVRELDPEVRVEVYLKLFDKYLREAEELYGRGDLIQSGEKYWGAVTSLLSAVAEKAGLRHYTHRDLWDVVEWLVGETGDPEYSTLFSLAEKLHANFHHNLLRRESFDRHREGVLRLIEMLRGWLGRVAKA